MDIFSLFLLAGGLAFFLFGMQIMGESLEKIGGGRLQKTLEKMTSGIFKGILLGTGVTAIIQSSSATTVMVVGFVNSGLLLLDQSIGIIMGANIGTTITAWILSLTQVQGTSFLLKLVQPTNFSPLLAFIGIVLLMFSKKQRRMDIGTMLIGFALLMFGMDMMGNSVAPLANEPWFTDLFVTMSKNPIIGILAGTILTAVIQSSSASVGILQALSITGAISFGSALPIILGQNIGTCVTALISSIGAKKNAKRAALIHFYFNIIGVSVIAIVFYALNAFFKFTFMTKIIDPVGIAITHTCYNVLATIILVPFSKFIIKLTKLTIKDDSFDRSRPFIDERFFKSPSIATEQSLKTTIEMATLAEEVVHKSFECLESYSESLEKEILEDEERVDVYEDVLGTYLVKLSSLSLSLEDSKCVSRLINTIGDLERISDHAINILNVSKEMHEKKISFSEEAKYEITVMVSAVKEILSMTIEALKEEKMEMAYEIDPLKEVVDELKSILKKNHVIRLQNGTCTIELGFILSDLLTALDRISAHCANIVGYMMDYQENYIGAHGYYKQVMKSTPEFKEKHKFYREKYIKNEIKNKYLLSADNMVTT